MKKNGLHCTGSKGMSESAIPKRRERGRMQQLQSPHRRVELRGRARVRRQLARDLGAIRKLGLAVDDGEVCGRRKMRVRPETGQCDDAKEKQHDDATKYDATTGAKCWKSPK